mgnify:CR=1 FL=1
MDTQKIVFMNKKLNLRLAGLLYLPDAFDISNDYPAVVVTGPMLSVKEQAQSVYAKKLTEAGYVTLVFDGAYFGESEGLPRGQEIPDVKESDIEVEVLEEPSKKFLGLFGGTPAKVRATVKVVSPPPIEVVKPVEPVKVEEPAQVEPIEAEPPAIEPILEPSPVEEIPEAEPVDREQVINAAEKFSDSRY